MKEPPNKIGGRAILFKYLGAGEEEGHRLHYHDSAVCFLHYVVPPLDRSKERLSTERDLGMMPSMQSLIDDIQDINADRLLDGRLRFCRYPWQ